MRDPSLVCTPQIPRSTPIAALRQLLLPLVFVFSAVCAWADDGVVDTRSALVVGSYAVSGYRVGKNFRRDLVGRPQDASAACAWFERFLIRQMITARALQEGYGGRTEVQEEVDRMEHHMLTQQSGPFYEALYAAQLGPPVSPAVLYARCETAYQIDALQIPSGAPIAEGLHTGAKDGDAMAVRLQESGQARSFSGWLAWPFEPFEGLAAELGEARRGVWQMAAAGDDVFYYRVKATRASPRPPLHEMEAFLAQAERRLGERRVRAERQRRILQEADFAFDWAAADAFVRRLTAAPPDPLRPLDEAALGGVLPALGEFRRNGVRHAVTVTDYIRYYNALFVRRLPVIARDVYVDTRALITALWDLDEARARGIDREPKFREDRENYRDTLALELFEKERIRPQLGVSEEEIARFYAGHREAFTHPRSVEGMLVGFDQLNDAQAFVQRATGGDRTIPAPARSRRAMVLSKQKKESGLEFLTGLVFSGPVDRVLGPFPTGDMFSVWLGARAGESETSPLSEVAAVIRTQLEQPKLEVAEAALAREVARSVAVADHIDYRAYGADGSIAKPWKL